MLVPRDYGPLANIPTAGSLSPSSLALGRIATSAGEMAELRDPSETHVLIFGPNGSGKMTRILAPNLLRLDDRSIFVIDPKGELAAITAKQRAKFSDVVVINPFGVLADIPGYEDLESSGFNPMMTLNPHLPSFNADASRLGDALIKSESKTQPYFDNSARELLTMIIMYVAFHADLTGRTPSLAWVRDILTNDREIERILGIIETLRERPPENLRGMINKAAQFGRTYYDDKLKKFVTTFADNESLRGVISTARQQTGFLDDTEIARDLNKNGVDFREAKKRPTTVYLILPAHELARHARWLRLIVTSALNAMMRPRRPDEPRVLFMMDEYPALGHMEIIETTWALVRGYGIQMMPVFQDMAQLRAIYKERADSFLGMAGAIVHLAPNDPTTIKWIMERAGEWHKIVHGGSSGQQQGREMSNSRGQSWHKERVPRWTAQDLYGMKRHYMLLALAGERDIWQVVAPHYYNVAAYDAVARKNPYIAGL